RGGGAAETLAFLIALWWTVHPLQAETVTCVIQRTESLVSLCYLLTLYLFVRGTTAEAGKARRWYAVMVVACLLGMSAMEVMVTAPVMVLVLDRSFFAGSFAAAWRLRARWYVALVVSLLLLTYLVLASGAILGMAAGFS